MEEQQEVVAVQTEEVSQHEKYKKPIQKYAKLQVTASVLGIVSIIVLLFVPSFKTLSGISFSLFLDLIAMIKVVVENSDNGGIYEIMDNIVPLMVYGYVIIAVVVATVGLVKNCNGLKNIDDFTIVTFDGIKKNGERKDIKKGKYDLVSLIVSIVSMLVVCGIYGRFSNGTSMIMYIGGISLWGWLFAVPMLVATVVLGLLAKREYKKIKLDVLREDYAVKQ